MGKNISGTGMDAKVVNRGPSGEYNPWPGLPSIRRIFVRDLDPETYGNAIGIGMADVTTDRLVRADRLGADTGQCAELGHAVADSRARALCHRSRMPAVGCGAQPGNWIRRR